MIPLTDLRSALDDPELLGPSMPGDSYLPMRVLLIAAMGEPLTDAERVVFQELTQREREPLRRVDELVVVKGRRAGGSHAMGKVMLPYLAGLCRWPSLTGGERGVLLVLAQDQHTADQVLDYAEDAFRASPMLSTLVESRVARTLRLNNGIDIEVRAADRRRLRGLTYIAIVADEIAHWPTGEYSANPDTKILNSIRPGLGTTRGPLFMISSPYAKRGELWSVYKRDFGADGDPAILVAQGASRVFNSELPQSLVDREYEKDPASAAAEYGAEFRADIASFIDIELIESLVDRRVAVRAPVSGVRYECFADLSSGTAQDSSAAAIIHREDDGIIVDLLYEKRPKFQANVAIDEICGICSTYRIREVVGDRYSVGYTTDRFDANGIYYRVTKHDTSTLYRECLPYLSSGRVRLLDNKRAIAQFASLERKTSPGGKDQISHPSGGHDDLSNCIAGAIAEAGSSRGEMCISDSAIESIKNMSYDGSDIVRPSQVMWSDPGRTYGSYQKTDI
jgi:hypothetical protein